MSDSRAEIGSVEELLATTKIRDILFMELSASRIDAQGERSDDPDREFDLNTMLRHEGTELDVRFLLEMSDHAASYRVDAIARYSLDTECSIPARVSSDFIERVAVFAAFPFLREALVTSAGRLRVDPPVLGILRQGDIKVSQMTERDTSPTS